MTRSDELPPPSKVLVLEKDDALREATRMLLEADGYGVITAASLPAALDAARGDPGIEMLLVDHHPPDGVIGTQAISALREVVGLRLKTLLLTEHVCASLRELEQDDHVRVATSPIGADALVAMLQALRDVTAAGGAPPAAAPGQVRIEGLSAVGDDPTPLQHRESPEVAHGQSH